MELPEVTGLSPKFGPDTGGTTVIIRGANLGMDADDIIGLTIAGVDCLSNVKWHSQSKISVVMPPGNGSGPITVTTASAGSGTSTLEFEFQVTESEVQEIGLTEETDHWVEEELPAFIRQGTMAPTTITNQVKEEELDPLGIKADLRRKVMTRQALNDLKKFYPQGSSRMRDANFVPTWFLVENYRDCSNTELQAGCNNLRRLMGTKSKAQRDLIKENLNKFMACKTVIEQVADIVEEQKKAEGKDDLALGHQIQNELETQAGTVNDLLPKLLSGRPESTKIRNALAVLEKFKFLFGLPASLKRDVLTGDYDNAMQDYRKAQYLYADRKDHPLFQIVLEECHKIMRTCAERLYEHLKRKPDFNPQTEILLGYLLELDPEGEPLWFFLGVQTDHLRDHMYAIGTEVAHQIRNIEGSFSRSISLEEMGSVSSMQMRGSASGLMMDDGTASMTGALNEPHSPTKESGTTPKLTRGASQRKLASTLGPEKQRAGRGSRSHLKKFAGSFGTNSMMSLMQGSTPLEWTVILTKALDRILRSRLPGIQNYSKAYFGGRFRLQAAQAASMQALAGAKEPQSPGSPLRSSDALKRKGNDSNPNLFEASMEETLKPVPVRPLRTRDDFNDLMLDLILEYVGLVERHLPDQDIALPATKGTLNSFIELDTTSARTLAFLKQLKLAPKVIDRCTRYVEGIKIMIVQLVMENSKTICGRLADTEDLLISERHGCTQLPRSFHGTVKATVKYLETIGRVNTRICGLDGTKYVGTESLRENLGDMTAGLAKSIRYLIEQAVKQFNEQVKAHQTSRGTRKTTFISTTPLHEIGNDASKSPELTLLALMGNIEYLNAEVLGDIHAFYLEAFDEDMTSQIDVLSENIQNLYEAASATYLRLKKGRLVRMVNSLFDPGPEWAKWNPPTKVRNAVREITILLTVVHAEVSCTMPNLLTTVMGEIGTLLISTFREEVSKAQGGINGYLQLKLELGIIRSYFKVYDSKEMVDEWNSLKDMMDQKLDAIKLRVDPKSTDVLRHEFMQDNSFGIACFDV
eukprot:Clim_evm17s44 gene=Clim_evmTU17s44